MAIDDYKNKEDISVSTNKGIRIDDADLKIFSRENTDAYFGVSARDNIEFALYDTNDNLLGWAIKDSQQIQLDAGDAQVAGAPKQILLDPKFDINELGFQTGIFKVSYQFFRNKLGSALHSQRAYIQEISPSREEVRILPVIYGNNNDEDRTIDFERFKLNILDDVVLAKLIDTLLKLGASLLSDNSDTLFIQQFQREFQFDDPHLVQLYEDILLELKTTLIALIKEEVYPTKEKIINLFLVTLTDILIRKIPPTSPELENPILNTLSDNFLTIEDLNKRIAEQNKKIQYKQPIQEVTTFVRPGAVPEQISIKNIDGTFDKTNDPIIIIKETPDGVVTTETKDPIFIDRDGIVKELPEDEEIDNKGISKPIIKRPDRLTDTN